MLRSHTTCGAGDCARGSSGGLATGEKESKSFIFKTLFLLFAPARKVFNGFCGLYLTFSGSYRFATKCFAVHNGSTSFYPPLVAEREQPSAHLRGGPRSFKWMFNTFSRRMHGTRSKFCAVSTYWALANTAREPAET